ncbi:MAG: hypothetical protein H7834_12270 [Magnetococcus sp. YQC-9]
MRPRRLPRYSQEAATQFFAESSTISPLDDIAASSTSGALRPAILGPLGPAQLTCLRSWRKLGLDPLFIHLTQGSGTPGWPGVPGDYLPLSREQLNLPVGRAQFCAFLSARGCTGLTCLGEADARLLRAMQSVLPCDLWLPSQESHDFLDSKHRQLELAQVCGFAVLPTWRADHHLLPMIPEDVFPLVARPDGSGTAQPMFKIRIVRNARELSDWLKGFHKLHQPVLLQPLIHGPNLVIHAATDVTGTPFALQAFLVRRKFEGVTLTIEPAPLDESLRNACIAFCRKAGIHGCLHFELVHDPRDTIPWFLEVNGRLGGTTGKVYALGFDEPRLLLSAHNLLSIPPTTSTILNGNTVCNRLALGKLLYKMARRDPRLLDDLSGMPRRWYDLLAGFFLWRDEIVHFNDLRTTVWYLRDWFSELLQRKDA